MARFSLDNYTALLNSDTPLGAPLRRIAYPTSLTELSHAALHWAIQIAKAADADLVLFHVLPPPVPLFEVEPFEKRQAEIALSLLVAQVNALGVEATGSLLNGTDSIGKQIARAASLQAIDFLVIGTGDRNRLFRCFRGRGIARTLVARAECPVLVIPRRVNSTRATTPMMLSKASLDVHRRMNG